jgi:N-carbamoyl-L-amino-acid hydrolase
VTQGAGATLPVNAARLWSDLMALGEITEPHRPYTRRAFSPVFAEGRRFLTEAFQAAGLSTRIDAAGNLIGRLAGTDPEAPAIALGSHSDTVPGGGRFDGVAGVVAALEVARSVVEHGLKLRHPLEVIDCLAEEPTDFGLSCVGSRGICGALDDTMLGATNAAGESLATALRAVGGDPAHVGEAVRHDLRAFLELHIEQGPVLEASGTDIGVVSSIVGIRRIEIVFEGEATHAGTAPMTMRRDAAVPAAATLVEVRRAADALAAESGGCFVATVGIIEAAPGGANVVPRRARIVIDARSAHARLIEDFTRHIDRFSLERAREFRVDRVGFASLSDGTPTVFAAPLRAVLSRAADSLGLRQMTMASGAGHDAAFLARVCPAAMIFVPCLRGMSHTPDEWATREAVAAGAGVLLGALGEIDGRGGEEVLF